MNDPISWDPSLVKKFSSSNHYKLLNQLRSEVKKYPLNNRKKTPSTQINDTSPDNKNFSNNPRSKNSLVANNSNHSNDSNINKTTVSFNNAKNFSIYNKTNNINRQNESITPDQLNLNDDSSSKTFKERLNHIDMK